MIKDGVETGFWGMVSRFFNSKYIVFEYKSRQQGKKLKQNHYIVTAKYLYTKAFRNVAIVISNNGADYNAEVVARGILREEGKLIIGVDNSDMINMIRQRIRGKNPADILMEKLNQLMLELEK